MKIDVLEFLREAEINEAFYPGKRLVHECRQAGEYKSHCIVFDWRNPDKIRIEIKAGLTGRSLEPKQLKYYPVCFQSPTFVDIELVNDNETEDDTSEESQGSKGKASGGGGRKPAKKKLESLVSSNTFGRAMEGHIPNLGDIKEMVVMGSKIAAESYGKVMHKLAEQIKQSKIKGTELLAQAGNFIKKYTPPSFMKPSGTEDATYKYDREKNADIGYMRSIPS